MPTGKYTANANIGGLAMQSSVERTGGGGEGHEVALAAGNTAQLTTRTDADTGVITGAEGHTITDDKVDVYWADGKRIGMDATVVDLAITVDGGAGDDLPANLTAVVVSMQQTVEDVAFDGDNMKMLLITCNRRCSLDFIGATCAVLEIANANEIYAWADNQGVTTPITGAAVTSVVCSNGEAIAGSLEFAVILES